MSPVLAPVRTAPAGRGSAMKYRSRRLAFAAWLGLLLLLTGTLPAAHAQEPTPGPTATAVPTPSAPPPIVLGPEVENMLNAIESGEPVFVSQQMSNLVGPTELEDLRALAAELSQRGYPLRVAVISSIPEGFPSLAVFTDELHGHLGLDKGILIVATQTGVSARTNRLDVSEIQDLTNQASSVFQNSGYAAGIRTLTQALVDAIQARQADNARRALAMFFGMLILLLVGLIAFLFLRRNRWQSALSTAREEHHRLAAAADLIESELAALPRGPTTLEALQAFEPAQRELDAIATQIAAVSRASLVQVIFRTSDWEVVLKDALAGLHDVRSALRRAQDIAARSSPAFRPVPLPAPIQPVAAIGGAFLTADDLQSRLAPYGGPLTACFFCAQPMQANVAGQIEADLGGRWRQLLACENHAALVARGEEPLVRLVDSDGGEIPWFTDPQFVPYRDYDPQYTRGLTLAEVEPYVATLDKSAVVITTDDPRWIEFQAESGGSLGVAADSLPEGADYGPAGYPTEADYTYAAPTVYQPGSAPAAEPADDSVVTPQERKAAEFLEPDLRAAFERAIREAEGTPDETEPAASSASPSGSEPMSDLPAGFHPDYGAPPGAAPAGLEATTPEESAPADWPVPHAGQPETEAPETPAPDEPAAANESRPEPPATGISADPWAMDAGAPPAGEWQLPEDLDFEPPDVTPGPAASVVPATDAGPPVTSVPPTGDDSQDTPALADYEPEAAVWPVAESAAPDEATTPPPVGEAPEASEAEAWPVESVPIVVDPWAIPAGAWAPTTTADSVEATPLTMDQPATGGRANEVTGDTSDVTETAAIQTGIGGRSSPQPVQAAPADIGWLPAAEFVDGWLSPSDAAPNIRMDLALAPVDPWADPHPPPVTPVAVPATELRAPEIVAPEAAGPPAESPGTDVADSTVMGATDRPADDAPAPSIWAFPVDAPTDDATTVGEAPPSTPADAIHATSADPWSWDTPAEPAPEEPRAANPAAELSDDPWPRGAAEAEADVWALPAEELGTPPASVPDWSAVESAPAASGIGDAEDAAGIRHTPVGLNAGEATAPPEATTPQPAAEDSRPDESVQRTNEMTPPVTAPQRTSTGAARPSDEAADVVEDDLELPVGDLVLDFSVLEDTEPDVLPGRPAAETRPDATPSAPSAPKRPPPPPPVITDPDALAQGRRPGAAGQPPQSPPQSESRD